MNSFISKMVRRATLCRQSAYRSRRIRCPRLTLQNLEERAVPTIYTVTNINDTGTGSLNQAIADANADGADDEIVFDTAGVFGSPQTIALTTALPLIEDNGSLTITGTGVNNLKVDAGDAFRVFDSVDSDLNLSGFTVTRGLAANATGGGLRAGGIVTLDQMVFDDNNATGTAFIFEGGGGAISMNSGSFLKVSNSTISGNSAERSGGGILCYFGGLVLENSTVTGNSTFFSGTYFGYSGGGGLAFLGTPSGGPPPGFTPYTAVILNSTIVGNTTSGSGGALSGFNQFGSPGVFLVQDSTVTGNNADSSGAGPGTYPYGGGGLTIMFGGNIVVRNSVVSGNTNGTSPDIQSKFAVDTSFSLIGDTSGFTEINGAGNLAPGTDPLLGTLQNNGGPTETMAPQAGSPLLEAGSDALIPDGVISDQRGFGYVRSYNGSVDIGSVEVQPPGTPVAQAQSTNLDSSNTGETTYTFTVTFADPTGSNQGIDVDSIIDNDGAIRVTGPNGFDQLATYESIDDATDGTPRTATYSLSVPGGTWDSDDSGIYTINVVANQVFDFDGTPVPASKVGKFIVDIPPIVVRNANDSGAGSLRDAILVANSSPTDDEIIFDPGFFNTHQDINLQSALPVIAASGGVLTITGPGVANLTIDAGDAFRVLDSLAPILNLSDFTVTGGRATNGFGGGLRASGTVYIDHMVFTGNSAVGTTFDTGGGGIGMTPFSFLSVKNSTISGNSGIQTGGGILFRYGGGLVVENSTVNDNTTAPAAYGLGAGYYGGGGIWFVGAASSYVPPGFTDGTIVIRNSTIANNNATTGSGGGFLGFLLSGTLLIQDSTITGNNADPVGVGPFGLPYGGGGIGLQYYSSADITIQNSVVSGNTNGDAPDILSTGAVNVDFSAIGSTSGFTLVGSNNLIGQTLLLGPLQDNGGPTETMEPLAGSPLLDAGSDDLIPVDVTSDQRGFGFTRSYNDVVDIGAVEVQPIGTPIAIAQTTNLDSSNTGETTYTFTVLFADPTGTNNGIKVLSIIDNNTAIRVTGPNGFDQFATYESIDDATDGTPRTATYSLSAPGGAWNNDDSGIYTVNVVANQVFDLDGTPVSASKAGKFIVDIPPIVVRNANNSGAGSLRDAILVANSSSTDDVIIFDPGFFNTHQDINLLSSLPTIAANGGALTITGPGVANLTVNGGDAFRVLDSKAPTLTLSDFTITGGLATNATGGGLRASGIVTVDHMVFDKNNATGTAFVVEGGGGGIAMTGGSFLKVSNSTISGNSAGRSGGGILCYFGGLILENSTVTGNSATFTGTYLGYSGGGGLAFLGTPSSYPPPGFTPYTAVILNSTIVGNTTTGSGGGLVGFNQFGSPGIFLVQDSTVTGNNADSSGAGTYGYPYGGGGLSIMFGGNIVVRNSVVSGNTNSTSPDIQSRYSVDTSFSLIGDTNGFVENNGSGNVAPGTDPQLGPLQDNGGPTKTMAPLTGSPLINAGSDDLIPDGVNSDQRGFGFYRSYNGTVDIGAVEDQPVGGPFVFATTPDIVPGATTYEFTVTYADPNGTNNGIDVSTVIGNNNAVHVTGPGGVDLPATYISIDDGTNGTPRTVTYSITPPGGSWNNVDDGHYTVRMQANQVADLDGNFAPATSIGRFVVVIPPFIVTNDNDSGDGSLRAAITFANSTPDSDLIEFDPVFFSTHQDITLQTALPVITNQGGGLTITGPGAANLTVDAGGNFRVFESNAPDLTMTGFTVANGFANNSNGGGLLFNGFVTLDGMVFSGNRATGNAFNAGSGAAIAARAFGILDLKNTTVSGNVAQRSGGGVYFFYSGALLVENSTISGNSTTDAAFDYTGGGGVYMYGYPSYYVPPGFESGAWVIRNSTIANNSSASSGGGVQLTFSGDLLVQSSTISGNSAANTGSYYGGGGIGNYYSGIITIENSVVGGNTNASGPDIRSDNTVNVNYSAISNTTGFTVTGSNNILDVDPMLGPLQDNGGPTFTMAPLPGSPLINAGSDALIPVGVTTDQRGGQHVRSFGAAVDMGAYEVQPPGVTINQGATQPDPTNAPSIEFDVKFEQDVTGFDETDIDLSASTVGGSLVASVTGSGSVYTVTVTGMAGQGDVIASIPAGAADGADGPSTASTSTDNIVAFDAVGPAVTIDQGATQADPTSGSTIVFDVHFNEPVTGFDETDISFTGSTVGGTLVATVTGSGADYTVSVTGMAVQGTVVASIPAGAANDLLGNASEASTSTDNTVTFDKVAPTVTIEQAIGQVDPTSVSPIAFTVHFSEPVTGFDGSDVSFTGSTVGGTLVAAVTGSGADYTVNVTGMTGQGTVVASIPANVATDLAGNLNAASTSTDNSVSYDSVKPSVTINQAVGQSDPTNVSSIKFDVKFTENVTGFTGTDVDLSASSAGGTLVATVTGNLDTYTVTVTGMSTRGFVIATIPADAAIDQVGNTSLASSSTDNQVEFLNTGTLGFSQAVFDTTEDATAHTVTITVTRAGQTDGAVSIQYGTSDGSAHSGGSATTGQDDYTPTSGTLSWADGEGGDKTFTVSINPDALNEGKELIKLALTNPVGSPGLALTAANAAIARSDGAAIPGADKKRSGKFVDQDGDKFTIALGGNTGSLVFYRTDPDGNGNGPIDSIQLIGTLPDPLKPKATLSISVTKVKTSTDGGTVALGGIDGDGIKSISARKANLNGDGIILNGYLNALTIGNVSGGADITTLATTNIKQTTRINALEIGDGTTITVGAPLANLTAKQIGVGSIVAPSIGTMSVTGQVKPTIIGDMASKITLSGAGVAAGKLALGSLTVKGSIPAGADIIAPSVGKIVVKKTLDADITISGIGIDAKKNALGTLTVTGAVTGSDIFVKGNVGTVTVGGFHGSRLFAGYIGPDDPIAAGFNFAATVTRFNVNGKTDVFEDSRVVATNFKTVTIKNLDSTNASKFGFYADTSLGAISVTNPKFKYNNKLPTPQGIPGGQFEVKIIV